MYIDVYAAGAEISAHTESKLKISIVDVDIAALLDEIGLAEAMDHFPQSDILDHIGKEAVMNYFDVTEE